jgi:hypothetical protein
MANRRASTMNQVQAVCYRTMIFSYIRGIAIRIRFRIGHARSSAGNEHGAGTILNLRPRLKNEVNDNPHNHILTITIASPSSSMRKRWITRPKRDHDTIEWLEREMTVLSLTINLNLQYEQYPWPKNTSLWTPHCIVLKCSGDDEGNGHDVCTMKSGRTHRLFTPLLTSHCSLTITYLDRLLDNQEITHSLLSSLTDFPSPRS